MSKRPAPRKQEAEQQASAPTTPTKKPRQPVGASAVNHSIFDDRRRLLELSRELAAKRATEAAACEAADSANDNAFTPPFTAHESPCLWVITNTPSS